MMNVYKKSSRIMMAFAVCAMLAGAVSFAIPSFADSQDELKEIFVTRDDWDYWKEHFYTTDSITYTSITDTLDYLESNMQAYVQQQVKAAMKKRNINDNTSSS